MEKINKFSKTKIGFFAPVEFCITKLLRRMRNDSALRTASSALRKCFAHLCPQSARSGKTGSLLFGFSLIELMISLIAISVITAAFTPVISKKLQSGDLTIGGEMMCSDECHTKFSNSCDCCYGNKCVSCYVECEDNQYKNIGTCQCENCIDRDSSGQCIRCGSEKCSQCALPGYYINSNRECEKCPIGSKCPDGKHIYTCEPGTYNLTEGSADCITCEVGYKCEGGSNHEICTAGTYSSGNASSCTTCEAGYYCPGGTDRQMCQGGTYNTTSGRTDCDICPANSYCSGSSKQDCITSSNQGSATCAKTANCDIANPDGSCTSGGCAQNYKNEGTGCTPMLLTQKIGSYTWTLRNPGDTGGPVIPNTVNVYDISQNRCIQGAGQPSSTCGSTTPTCWKGNTAGTGTIGTQSDGYSGANRTVCNWFAGSLICGNMNAQYGINMSFPTRAHLGSLSATTAITAKLCTLNQSNQVFSVCTTKAACIGALSNSCQPATIFSSDENVVGTKHSHVAYWSTAYYWDCGAYSCHWTPHSEPHYAYYYSYLWYGPRVLTSNDVWQEEGLDQNYRMLAKTIRCVK